MKSILFLVFEFPPINAGGSQRPLKFAQYLPNFEVNPIVLTMDSDSKYFENFHKDNSQLEDLPENTTIIKLKSKSLQTLTELNEYCYYFFNLVRRESKYIKDDLEKRLPEFIEKYAPKAILITAPPFSMIPLAIKVANKYNLPLIIDLRDAWSQWITTPYLSFVHYRAMLRLEYNCLKKAAAIITTSKQTRDDLLRIHKKLNPAVFHYIPNGIDRYFDNGLEISIDQKDEIIIGYVGSFYYDPSAYQQMFSPWYKKKLNRMLQYVPRKEDWKYRSPYFFFKALHEVFTFSPELKSKVKVHFVGKKPYWIMEMVEEFDLADNCMFLGVFSLEDSLKFQQNADFLLLTSSKVVGGRDYSIAGKTFEYFLCQRPIIGFVAEGSQKDMLIESEMAIVCNPDDSAASAKQLIDAFKNNISLKPNVDFLNSLNRRKHAKQLAGIIGNVVK